LDDLSPALRREVVLFLNKEMVENVPFFQGQDDAFICRLILSMTTEICAPLDFVIRQGEVGRCMYFLRRGLVEVCNKDASKVFTTLADGAHFGEVSLLVGGHRTASVRAILHSSLLRLEQEALDDILIDYPQILKAIVKLAANAKYQLTDAVQSSLQNRFALFQKETFELATNRALERKDDDLQAQETTNRASLEHPVSGASVDAKDISKYWSNPSLPRAGRQPSSPAGSLGVHSMTFSQRSGSS